MTKYDFINEFNEPKQILIHYKGHNDFFEPFDNQFFNGNFVEAYVRGDF